MTLAYLQLQLRGLPGCLSGTPLEDRLRLLRLQARRAFARRPCEPQRPARRIGLEDRLDQIGSSSGLLQEAGSHVSRQVRFKISIRRKHKLLRSSTHP